MCKQVFSLFFNGKQSFLFFLNGKVLSLWYISFHPVRAGIFVEFFGFFHVVSYYFQY